MPKSATAAFVSEWDDNIVAALARLIAQSPRQPWAPASESAPKAMPLAEAAARAAREKAALFAGTTLHEMCTGARAGDVRQALLRTGSVTQICSYFVDSGELEKDNAVRGLAALVVIAIFSVDSVMWALNNRWVLGVLGCGWRCMHPWVMCVVCGVRVSE